MIKKMHRWIGTALLGLAVTAGCSNDKAAQEAQFMAQVGTYDPAPSTLERLRVGVVPFEITDPDLSPASSVLSADAMTSLLVPSNRFVVIQRVQLDQLLRAQGLTGPIRPETLVQAGPIEGVDLLVLGRISNFRVTPVKGSGGMTLGGMELPPLPGSTGGGAAAYDYTSPTSQMNLECQLSLQIIRTSNHQLVAAYSGDFEHAASIGAFGVDIRGFRTDVESELDVADHDKHKLIRVALDHGLRQLLPQVDQAFLRLDTAIAPAPAAAPATPATAAPQATSIQPTAATTPTAAPATPATSAPNATLTAPAPVQAAPATAPATAPTTVQFCRHCGEKLAPADKFCGHCGQAATR